MRILSIFILFLTIAVINLHTIDVYADSNHQLFDILIDISESENIPMSELEKIHCFTPLVLDTKLSKHNLSEFSLFQSRPTLPLTYISPEGHFALHYAVAGADSIQEALIDTLDGGDGVPDFINQTAVIFDSVWNFEIDSLGYPAPPSDEFYPNSDGPEYDVYFYDFHPWFAAYTTYGYFIDEQTATSYIVIDSDARTSNQTDIPLDAIRDVMAHEFFHSIQIGMDYSEYDGPDTHRRRYWIEISATWMEEIVYPDLNLYFDVLPFYYNYPWVSLQHFSQSLPLHHYAAMVFPLYLSQKWGVDIIKDIWQKCADWGPGSQFTAAVDAAVQDYSGDTEYLLLAMREFALWNLFTGTRRDLAPDGMGFEEGDIFPEIPDSVMIIHDSYPVSVEWPFWLGSYLPFVPENLAATYIRLDNIDNYSPYLHIGASGETGPFWNFSVVLVPNAIDSPLIIFNESHVGGGQFEFAFDTRWYSQAYLIVTPVKTNSVVYSDTYGFSYDINIATDIEESNNNILPDDFSLEQNYPNPFNPLTTIEFSVPYKSEVSIDIFNILGQKVLTPVNCELSPGDYTVTWNGTDSENNQLSSGIYIYQLKAGNFIQTKRMQLIR